MNLVYNSDHFTVLQIDLPSPGDTPPEEAVRGGFEIVDKSARQGIFIEGALALRFRAEAQALVQRDASSEDIDDYLAGYTALASAHPALH
jgi:hypothetical protein